MTEIRGGLQIGPLATSEDAREKSRATSRTRQVPGQRPPVTASLDGRWLCGGGGFHALAGPKVDLEGPDSSGFIWELGAELWVVVETLGAEADVPLSSAWRGAHLDPNSHLQQGILIQFRFWLFPDSFRHR